MFYKYKSSKNIDQIVSTIRYRKMYFADWSQFNDIGEGNFEVDSSAVSGTIFEHGESGEILSEQIIKHKFRYSVLCSTTNSRHALMWSLYAGEHNGVCIGFSPRTNVKRINVNYSRIVPKIKPKIDDQINEQYLDRLVEEILGTKSIDFSSESEVRFISKSAPGLELVHIHEVIIGARCNDKIRGKVIRLCRSSNIDVYDIQSVRYDYNMQLKNIIHSV